MPDDVPVIKKLGKARKKEDVRNLRVARYLATAFPTAYDWQKNRSPMPSRTFGNTSYGDCTLASQANGVSRFERMEQRRTILLPDQTVIKNYLEMTGGADDGWFELDAIKRWRTTGFEVSTTRKYTIDAFAEINTHNVDEIKAALWQFKVIKICFGLPWAWSNIDPVGFVAVGGREGPWDVGTGPDYETYSWGGHSMTADSYDSVGLYVVHTWFVSPTPVRQLVTWAAVQQYADEAYSIVDSFDSWRTRKAAFDLKSLETDVAKVTAG